MRMRYMKLPRLFVLTREHGVSLKVRSIYLTRVELVKLSEMLEKAYIPRRSEFGGFLHARDIRAIPT